MCNQTTGLQVRDKKNVPVGQWYIRTFRQIVGGEFPNISRILVEYGLKVEAY